MSDAPTEETPGNIRDISSAQPPNYEEPYRGEERRGGDRRATDRRIGERRITERRSGVDPAAAGTGGKQRAGAGGRKRDQNRFWYDFMRFNLTGWSVVVPTLAGLAIGNWIDNRYPAGFSWALTLMSVGLFLGCLNAWYWIRHQDHGENR